MKAARNQLLNLLETDFLSQAARKTVFRYVSRKAIPARELEDVEMTVIEKFINQKQQIVANFKGKSQASTYIIAIVNRMCCEVIRKEWKHWQAVDNQSYDVNLGFYPIADNQPDHALLINLELERLQFALNKLQQSVPSAEPLLMFHFELKPQQKALKNWAGLKLDQLKIPLDKLTDASKTTRYQLIATMLSVVEGKNIKPDALRMRIYKYMDMLIADLNRNDQSQHTRETLKLLFEIRVQHSESNTKPSAVERFRFDKTVLLIILLNSLPWIF
ncbi:MAG: hypothetical protein M0Q90_10815 [Bacteroidales bacterium]|nr:hypothetical protein [Bacteroidales bacterium]